MTPNPNIMQAVEQLGYRVTVGDVVAKAGLDVNFAQRELLALASDVGGNLQVAESGEIAYSFPQNFRDILRNKFLWLQLQEWWAKIWRVLFYLIRISFGIVLLASILLIIVSITVILTALNSSNNNSGGSSNSNSGDGGFRVMPYFFNDWWWFFYWNNDPYYRRERQNHGEPDEMNFLESVFSFIFGDGNPNYNLNERRWQAIGRIIRNHQGAIAAEQIAPYLDRIGQGVSADYEGYMLPVLTRFEGRPEVSPEGQIVYHFPTLQTTAAENNPQPVASYLREFLYKFSEASSGQIWLAAGLGVVNLGGALILGKLLGTPGLVAKIGEFIIFVQAVYPMLLTYGVAFLSIPLVRYFWIQWRNSQIEARNQARQQRAARLNQPDETLRQKLNYARQFAAENVISGQDLAYTTETDLMEQESAQSAKLDAEWQRRLNQSDV
ncbi:hypothetical protein BCD67_25250 [Oscillatoriales cyanobacterium USR001]|nr:hypothetical protein BCD67_25250 [Oscillatoriales cyanobacterium USR001]